MAAEAKSAFGSFREVAQDLLVPELKAVKVAVDSLRTETKMSIDALRNETRASSEALRNENKILFEALRQEMKLRDELFVQTMRSLSDKLDYAIDIRERLATLEARMPKQ